MSQSTEATRTIFYVDDDDDTRPGIKRLLTTRGYRVVVANSEEDVVERAADGRVRANLLLVDLGHPPEVVLDAARRMRQVCMLDGETPILVIALSYGEDMEGRDINVGGNEWVTYLEDAEQLERLVDRLCQPPALSDHLVA